MVVGTGHWAFGHAPQGPHPLIHLYMVLVYVILSWGTYYWYWDAPCGSVGLCEISSYNSTFHGKCILAVEEGDFPAAMACDEPAG